jgi:hypothetical protein
MASIATVEIGSGVEMEDTREPDAPESADPSPNEARKGWWQRRFKI